MAGTRDLLIRMGFDQSHLDGQITTARTKLKRMGQQAAHELGHAIHGAFEGLGHIAGFAGIAGIGVAIHEVLSLEKKLDMLQVTSRSSKADMAGLRESIHELGAEAGITGDKVLEGLQAFVNAGGSLADAKKSIGDIAKISLATGAPIEEVARSTRNMQKAMNLTAEDTKKVFNVIAEQSKGVGSFGAMQEAISGAANEMAEFGKTGVRGVAEIGAAIQTIAPHFKTPQEAGEAITGMLNTIVRKKGELAKKGISIFELDKSTGKRELKDIGTLLDEIKKKTGGDPGKILDILGAKGSARRAFIPLITESKQAYQDRVDAALKSVAADKMEEDQAKTTAAALGRLHATLEKIASEAVVGHIGQITSAFTLLTKAVGFLAEHMTMFVTSYLALKAAGPLGNILGAAGVGGGIKGIPGVPGLGPVAGAIGAGVAGYAIGTALDEGFKISDRITGTGTHSRVGEDFSMHELEKSSADDFYRKIQRGQKTPEEASEAFLAQARASEHAKPGQESEFARALAQSLAKEINVKISIDRDSNLRHTIEEDRQTRSESAP